MFALGISRMYFLDWFNLISVDKLVEQTSENLNVNVNKCKSSLSHFWCLAINPCPFVLADWEWAKIRLKQK